MALYEDKSQETSNSYKKTINEDSMEMVMDVLQSYQYTKPVQSCVREACLNAIDSNKEKEIAKSIKMGLSKVEDHYVIRDGGAYEASKFKPDYYDLDYLSNNDLVELVYVSNTDLTQRDEFIISDYGVGLGGERLEGFMQLSYSTKRNSKGMAGKWGLGNKAPLSTGVESFRVVSYYNGRRFEFDVFSHSCQSVIGKFGPSGMNQKHEFSNGYVFYSEPTTRMNGVEIRIPVKKHNKFDFINAVKTQLLYVKHNVEFHIKEGDKKTMIQFKPKIIFESDDIILSNASVYSSPHIVINGTCYGPIDFTELELDAKYGNIGILVDANDVDVSPSRESVLWTQKTKDTVIAKYENARKTAKSEIEGYLSTDNLMKWYSNCYSVYYNRGDRSKYHTLAGLLSKEDKEFKFNDITFINPFGFMFGGIVTTKQTYLYSKYVGGTLKRFVTTEKNSSILFDKLYIKQKVYSLRTAQYMLSSNSYYTICADTRFTKINNKIEEYLNGSIEYNELESFVNSFELDSKHTQVHTDALNTIKENIPKLKNIVNGKIPKLDDVVVPANFVSNDIIDKEESDRRAAEDLATKKARRKENKSFPYYMYDWGCRSSFSNELKSSDINDSYFYYFQEDSKDVEDVLSHLSLKNIKIGRIAKGNAKYFGKENYYKNILKSEDGIYDLPEKQKIAMSLNKLIQNVGRLKNIKIADDLFSKMDKYIYNNPSDFIVSYDSNDIKNTPSIISSKLGINQIRMSNSDIRKYESRFHSFIKDIHDIVELTNTAYYNFKLIGDLKEYIEDRINTAIEKYKIEDYDFDGKQD